MEASCDELLVEKKNRCNGKLINLQKAA